MIHIEKFELEELCYFRLGYNPFGKPFLYTSIFYFDGLLIDTGQQRVRKKLLDNIGYLTVNQIFITHHHEDHSGNIPLLKQHFKCDVFAPAKCCEIMKAPPPISFAQNLVWGNRPPYHDLIPLDDYITTNQYELKIIPIPGHADDMVALFLPQKGWLFSADLYLHSYIGYFMKAEKMATQIASIKKIMKLDFNTLLCSHNPQLTNGKDKLGEKLQFLEDFYGKVKFHYDQGLKAKEIYKAMNLKEHGFIHLLSHGELTKLNMVRSVVRDLDQTKQ